MTTETTTDTLTDKSLNLYRPVAVLILFELIAIAAVQVWHVFEPSSDLSYLLLACPLACLEGLYSAQLMKAQHLQSPDIPRFRFLEIFVLAVLVRIISALTTRAFIPALRTVDLRLAVGALVVLILWLSALDTSRDFDRLDEPPIPVVEGHNDYVSPLSRLTKRVFSGGVLMFAGIGVLTLDHVSIVPLVPAIFAYFVIGLVSLPGMRFQMSRRRWRSLGIPTEETMAIPWMRAGVIVTVLATVFAILLPTGYLSGLLDVLRSLFTTIISIAVFIVSLIGWLLSLPFHLLSGTTPQTPPNLPIMPMVPPTDATPPPGDSPLLGLLARIIPLAIVLYLVLSYFRDHPELWEMIEKLRLWQFLVTLWKALRRGFGSFIEGVRVNLPTTLPLPFLRRRSLQSPIRLPRLRGMSPRERVLYFYLSVLNRAGQQGIPRAPDQTPHEYSGTLKPSLPDAQQDLDHLSDAFVEARYSRHPVDPAEAEQAQADWRHVRQALKNVGKPDEK